MRALRLQAVAGRQQQRARVAGSVALRSGRPASSPWAGCSTLLMASGAATLWPNLYRWAPSEVQELCIGWVFCRHLQTEACQNKAQVLHLTARVWTRCCASRSACVREMIVVYTSNHPESLDPALLRPGRCDLHICLSFCSFEVRLLQSCARPVSRTMQPCTARIVVLLCCGGAAAMLQCFQCHAPCSLALGTCHLQPVHCCLSGPDLCAACGRLRPHAQVCQDLCKLYLGIGEHKQMGTVRSLIAEQGVRITPAEVTGVLDVDR